MDPASRAVKVYQDLQGHLLSVIVYLTVVGP
jgi:hypothetical protein